MTEGSSETTTTAHAANDYDDYDAFLAHVAETFQAHCAADEPLFTTNADAEGLWDLYLNNFTDPADRQHHTCHACRQFIRRYGGLVTIDSDGRTTSAIWAEDGTPEHFRPAVAAMARAVRRAKVSGVFVSTDRTWGIPRTGTWRHLAVYPPLEMVTRRGPLTAWQVMAEKREDYLAVVRALNEFSLPHLETALVLLRSDALYRSEKVLGQAEWLHALHVARGCVHGTRSANVVWRAVATAPAGFAHPRSSMIGTLLEDIAAGKDYDDVSRAFAAKMNPLVYQRPQAAPAAGAIAAAEKIVQELGAAGSLARRFTRVDEIEALWRPTPPKGEAPGGGVFSHLTPKGSAPTAAMRISVQTMTWVKFEREVLPTADRIEIQAPTLGSYAGLVTAVDPDAPPILQWDHEEQRNPVSWYVWAGGSPATQWRLHGGQFYNVPAITLQPSMWGGGYEHQGKGVLFLIDGAAETREDSGAGLFPEILKAEFRGIRSVIEAYSRHAEIEGMGEPHAAGLMLTADGSSWDAVVRVWSAAGRTLYRLDRWD
jgi:hypothetical protein